MAVDNENLALVQGEISKLESDSESAINDLKAAASARATFYTSQEGFDNNPNWVLPTGREVSMAGLGDLPVDKPELDIPIFTFNPEDYLNSDLLKKYSYQSEFYEDVLEPKLLTLIEAQSYFISEAVQDALFNQTRDRDLQILNDLVDATDRKQSTRGFPMTTDMQMAARNEHIVAHGDKRADRNREITALIAERAHDGMKHAITEGNKMEQVRSQFQLEYGRLYWNAAQYIINQWEAEVRAQVAEYQGEIDLIKLGTGVSEAGADFDLKYSSLEQAKQLERLRTTVSEMTTNFESWKKSAEQRVAAAESALDYYRGNIESALGVITDVAYKDETGATP
jgi:hypothetical protein